MRVVPVMAHRYVKSGKTYYHIHCNVPASGKYYVIDDELFELLKLSKQMIHFINDLFTFFGIEIKYKINDIAKYLEYHEFRQTFDYYVMRVMSYYDDLNELQLKAKTGSQFYSLFQLPVRQGYEIVRYLVFRYFIKID